MKRNSNRNSHAKVVNASYDKGDCAGAIVAQRVMNKPIVSNYYAIFADGFRYEYKPEHNIFAEYMAHEMARQRHTRVIIVKKMPVQTTSSNKKSLP